MELQLRIECTFGVTGENGLDIIERFALCACNISEERSPTVAFQQSPQFRQLLKELRADRHAPGNGVALLLLTAVELAVEKLLTEPHEPFGRKEVAHLDIAVAV